MRIDPGITKPRKEELPEGVDRIDPTLGALIFEPWPFSDEGVSLDHNVVKWASSDMRDGLCVVSSCGSYLLDPEWPVLAWTDHGQQVVCTIDDWDAAKRLNG